MSAERWDTGVDYDDTPRGRGRHTSRLGAALARVFGDQENPLTWGFPLFRAWGITVRAHIVLPVFLLVQLIVTLRGDHSEWYYTLPVLAWLIALVILHEFGHCFACRRVGGEADEIMLWPLGGLASCRPPKHWAADLLTTAGGPAVNALLLVPIAGAVWAVTGQFGAVLFNPFDFALTAAGVTGRDGQLHWWITWLWAAHYANLVLLLFNTLVPMYPMDAGRMLQAVLWARHGYRRSVEVAALVGVVVGMVLAVVGLVTNETLLLGIAIFGVFTCVLERRRVRLDAWADTPVTAPMTAWSVHEPDEPDPASAPEPAIDQGELDRVLAKISTGGMESLTRSERKLLKRATEAHRRRETTEH